MTASFVIGFPMSSVDEQLLAMKAQMEAMTKMMDAMMAEKAAASAAAPSPSAPAAAVQTTPCFRGPGTVPPVLPKITTGYLPMPVNPAGVKGKQKVKSEIGSRSQPLEDGSGSNLLPVPVSFIPPAAAEELEIGSRSQLVEDDSDGYDSNEEWDAASSTVAGASAAASSTAGSSWVGAPLDPTAKAAAKKAAKKQRQKEEREAAKAVAKAEKLEQAFSSAHAIAEKPPESLMTYTGVPAGKARAKTAPKRLAGPAPDMKKCKCDTCGDVEHWRGMRSNWTLLHQQVFQSDMEDVWEVKHTCIACVCKEPHNEGKTIDEVKEDIFAAPLAYKRRRAEGYQCALENAREHVDMRNASNTQIKKFARKDILCLFEPLGVYILRKSVAMQAVCRDVEEHARLRAMLISAKTWQEEQEIMQRMERLELDDKFLAFASKPDQHAWILASSYSDSWTEILNSKGELIGGICSYWPCFGNTRWGPKTYDPCCRVMPSKRWLRLHADPTQPGQRYYCVGSCKKRHQGGWGQLVEVKRMNERGQLEMFYMRAEAPPWDAEDIRAMHLEETVGINAKSATDLFDRIREIKPTLSELVIPDPTGEDMLMLRSKEAYFNLPEWSWWEIFTMTGAEPPKWAKRPASL